MSVRSACFASLSFVLVAGGAVPAWADFSGCESAYQATDPRTQVTHYTTCLKEGQLGSPEAVAFAYNNRGVAHMHLGEIDPALADFTAAIQFDPTWGQWYFNRGQILLNRGDFLRAEADFDKAIKLQPGSEHAEAYASRGQTRAQHGDIAGAIADFEAAIRGDRKLARAYAFEARLLVASPYTASRNGPKALELALTLVTLTDGWLSRDTLAAAYAETGRFDEAVREQLRAIDLAKAAGGGPDAAGMAARLALYQKGLPGYPPPSGARAAGG